MSALELSVVQCGQEIIRRSPMANIGVKVEEGSYEIIGDGSLFGYSSNFPCPICRKEIALFNMSQGTMNPCESCRKNRFLTLQLKKNNRFVRWILSLLMTEDSVPIISI